METHTFFVGADKYVLDDTNSLVLEQPVGSTLTYAQAKQLNIDNAPPTPPLGAGKPIVLQFPVTIANDALPVGLDAQQIFLEANRSYEFRFRATRYSSKVALALGFTVPGDADPATIAWNDAGLDGLFLGADDELTLAQFGNDEYISPEITETIKVNSEGGFFKPQMRQSTADAQTSEVSEAYLEVIEHGN